MKSFRAVIRSIVLIDYHFFLKLESIRSRVWMCCLSLIYSDSIATFLLYEAPSGLQKSFSPRAPRAARRMVPVKEASYAVQRNAKISAHRRLASVAVFTLSAGRSSTCQPQASASLSSHTAAVLDP